MEDKPKSEEFAPNEAFIAALADLGFEKDQAIKGLFATQNESVEAALNWILENTESEDEDDEDFEPHKMVLVVNTSLGMSAGKIAAQAGHATLGLYRELIVDDKHQEALASWEEYGEKKIALKGDSTEHLLTLQTLANEAGLPSYLVEDAGHTQIAAGSRTILAVFGKDDDVNKITDGKLMIRYRT